MAQKKRGRGRTHTQVQNISVFGAHAYMAPLALHYHGADFARSARLVTSGEGFSPARLYLVCHAIELLLKAFLSLHKYTLDELSDPRSEFAHNLNGLLDEAVAQGVQSFVNLDEASLGAIRLAARPYSEKLFEYPAIMEALRAYPGLPAFEPLLSSADVLVEALRDACLKAS